MTQVKIFHNVQRECRRCGEPVDQAGPGLFVHAEPPEDGHGAGNEAIPSGFDGYQPGHAMVLVFQTEVPDGQDSYAIAEQMFEAFNIGDGEMARAYRARELRSLSVGDVVVAGETPLHCASVGFEIAEGEFRQVWYSSHGSRALPHCSYCYRYTTGDDDTLEPFNMHNLACRDVLACVDRQRKQRTARTRA